MLYCPSMASSPVPWSTAATESSSHRRRIVYGILLILFVLAAIAGNVVFAVRRLHETVDAQTRRTAVIIGRMYAVMAADLLNDPILLQSRAEQTASAVPDLFGLQLLMKKGDGFIVVADASRSVLGKNVTDPSATEAWTGDRTVFVQTASAMARGWSAFIPLHDKAGRTAFLLFVTVFPAASAGSAHDTAFWSYLLFVTTALIVVLVLLSTLRLFKYADLTDQMRETEEMKDGFIAMVSHDLRAPIAAIRGYLSLLLESAFGPLPEKPRSIVQSVYRITDQLAEMIEDIVETSKLEYGKVKLFPKPVAAEDLVAEVMETFRPEAEQKKLAFHFERPEKPLPKIDVDPLRFKQALGNVMSNAIKYTPSGSVTVTARIKDNWYVEVRVADTGIGMSKKQLGRLFGKFSREKTDATRGIAGTGLGLWITKHLVNMMHGKISVESQENVGSRVGLAFPAFVEKTHIVAAQDAMLP